MRAKLKSILTSDTTLMAVLTGGVYDASDLPSDGLTSSAIPGAFNGSYLKPCALIRFGGESETEIKATTKRRFVHIFFYDQRGYTNIDAAIKRCQVLLDRKRHKAGTQVFYTSWVDNLSDSVAQELGNVPMARSRYYVDYAG